ncbi:MAG: hypothetical protein PHO37_15105 [Kiritimatiellae bacterium]|nr:hypothetical protein [Kiritimatiellia bacterium]
MNKIEEELYAQAARELATKTPVPGVMAKAFADADGDERRAFARYIGLRVEHLKDEIRRRQAEEAWQRQVESLKAWRRTGHGREDWIIQVSEKGLRLVETKTQENLVVSPKTADFMIEFHPHAFVHKIIVINRRGERFSFNAQSSTVEAVQAWWNSMM